ncbi:efflux RND transporter permease subunit [Hymenobacter canadensis]|uniref:Efflux RND transporter permease subunit n=1 Tax=Hymenobacter canadensis TaxID=2999067 RepID=A0ABY7LUE3_9BACT|nr:efflux RND transporter permease subunit [Hymenobacter canadensis]WBA44015.1 efflux RND transporter permease subunit [Hymenobacter canadensis]
MWIVRIALSRPYTFIVMALLILAAGVATIMRMAVDIFPEVNIPVVGVVWRYEGMSAEEMNRRVLNVNQRIYTTTVNNIEHLESRSIKGVGLIKVFFQPGTDPEAGVAQLTAVTATILRGLPQGIGAPLIIRYSASNVPIAQASLSSESLGESDLYDASSSFIRPGLAVVKGASLLVPNGGRRKQIMVDLNPEALAGKGLSGNDVVNTLLNQNVILPAGVAKIGDREYDVRLNSSPEMIGTLNDLPIKTVNGVPVYIRDVAFVHEGSAVQNNIVRQDGKRTAVIPILKSGISSTLDVIEGIKEELPRVIGTAPPGLDVKLLFDQSFFVRSAISGVVVEGLTAAVLTGLMILLFLGSWRSTGMITVSIPLAALLTIIILYICGQTLNIMTLSGLAMSIGNLVDDATVEVENLHRNMAMGKGVKKSILDSASEVALPALVSTMGLAIVFVPVFFLQGVAADIFTPLALTVIIVLFVSYFLSRTLLPTMAMQFMRKELPIFHRQGPERVPSEEIRDGKPVSEAEKGLQQLRAAELDKEASRDTPAEEAQEAPLSEDEKKAADGIEKSWIWRVHVAFEKRFNRLRDGYGDTLRWSLAHRKLVVSCFAGLFVVSGCLYPFIGQDFFPKVDAGQIRLHVRTATGTRLEETERRFRQVEQLIRQVVPAEELDLVLSNIGLPNIPINLLLSDNPVIGPGDGEILVALKEKHGPSQDYIIEIRRRIKQQYPDLEIFFQPADIVNQTLNFGLPAPIDVQISGRSVEDNEKLARRLQAKIAAVPGVVDAFVFQTKTPQLRLDVDRVRAQQAGLSQSDVADNVLVNLSSSTQTDPNQWLNPESGVNYTVAVQTPPNRLATLDAVKNIGITGPTQDQAQLLGNFTTTRREQATAVVSDYDIQRVLDIYASVEGRDLGGVSQDIRDIIKSVEKNVPKGSEIEVRGQVESMRTSFLGLGLGLLGAIGLLYLLMVVNFQSWLTPFIIIMALPGALSGMLWMLFVTQTTFSVPSLMGAIMCIGIATANSILVVSFANERLEADPDLSPLDAALDAGYTRLRPVLMTALAAIIGLLPMSLALGEGGEQNAPLARAVIGGLLLATFTTLLLVPIMYSLLKKKVPVTQPVARVAA